MFRVHKRCSHPFACYVLGMKTPKKGQKSASVATPALQDLIEREKANFKVANPTIGEKPVPSPDLYQDGGGGYNANFVFPQE